MEREDWSTLNIETFEKDVLVLGKPKRYRFELITALGSRAWSRYRRLAGR